MKREDFRQVSPYIYEIPKEHRSDMRVPARFYADEALLDMAMDDKSLEQLVNTTTLPGVVKYTLAMPDIHQGYGFPIGGVIATELPDGIISPGGIGYDINCLSGDSRILHADGYTRSIAEMEAGWQTEQLRCQNLDNGRSESTPIVRYLKQPPRHPVYRLTTESGAEIIATADHPFWTPAGMIELGRLAPGDQIARHPFNGVPYEAPDDTILVDQGDIERVLQRWGKSSGGNKLGQVMAHLNKKSLLPLQANSPQLPSLLRLLGYVFGDGTLYFSGENGKGFTWFYGKSEDLELIRQDVLALGFTPSRIYRRERHHTIQTTYGTYEFEQTSTNFRVSGTGFAALLVALGAPVGNKTTQEYDLPGYLFSLPRWQQRLFLATLFGAELSAPTAFTERNYNFYSPVLSLNKRHPFVENGRKFLEGLAHLLENFGVETKTISQRKEQRNADGSQSIRLRLLLSSRPESLINLWGRVGYEYNRQRQALAMIAIEYLHCKQQLVTQRAEAAIQAVALHQAGAAPQEIYAELESEHLNRRFLERSLYSGRSTSPRVSAKFDTFTQFSKRVTTGIEGSQMVWSTITAIEPVDPAADLPDGLVYDFTVAHPDHNFVANGFVVSNCGVRLLGTHLSYEEVKPHLDILASALQANCPSGVGQGGEFKLSKGDVEAVLRQGSHWSLKNGFAMPNDVERTEENGRFAAADPGKVSDRAKSRGRDQIGTLGAGNHFIEVDIVDEVFDEQAAQRMGLAPGNVVVQIHCGSRGLGHQVCTDYVRHFQKAIHKYGIQLPDRELVCVPLSSPDGQDYWGAMQAAANYAFANRQMLTFLIRRSFENALAGRVDNHNVYQIYDIAHNIAKIETHEVNGRMIEVCVHRKGATRAFGPGSAVLPDVYRDIGQPVLVPGSMGTASWVLVGTEGSMAQSFGSTCHGAGRTMSRRQAKREVRGHDLREELEAQGIHIRPGSLAGLAEEAPTAYKDVDKVIEVVAGAGIAKKVARIVPVAVVKG